MDKVRVLGRETSINARKVLWALDELGEAYEREDWGLPIRDPNVPQFLALNPNGMVPVLIDADGTTMWESNAILIYLAQTRGALLPSGRQELGRALQWLGWQATDLNFAWKGVQALQRGAPGHDEPGVVEQAVGAWWAKMRILEAELARREGFIAGDSLTIADIALGLSCHRWFKAAIDRPDLPAVSRYYQMLRQRPAGARWMPDDYG